MREGAQRVLRRFDADLVIFGRTELSGGEQWSLWFQRRSGESTIGYRDLESPYLLKGPRLHEDFMAEVREQLEAVALAVVAPLVDNEARGQVLREGLARTVERLSGLLSDETIRSPDRRSRLQEALGIAQLSLGEQESGPRQLEEAVTSLRTSLEGVSREESPREWSATQNNLGLALMRLGERQSGTGVLEEAVAALRLSLEEVGRSEDPAAWGWAANKSWCRFGKVGRARGQ